MIAEPNAMSHGLTTTGGGGAFTGILMSASNPEAVEQPRASAAAHARFFMTSPSPGNILPGFGRPELTSERGLTPPLRACELHRGTRYYGRRWKIQARLKSVT